MIGFRVVVEALQLGYKVRAAVRKEEGFEQIKAAKSVQPYVSQLEHVIVPDILPDGAYDEAIKGVDYIIHLASPISHPENKDYENDLIKPAVKGTIGILYSAIKEPSIKRVVITSSIVGTISFADIFSTKTELFSGKHPFQGVIWALLSSHDQQRKAHRRRYHLDLSGTLSKHTALPKYLHSTQRRNLLLETNHHSRLLPSTPAS